MMHPGPHDGHGRKVYEQCRHCGGRAAYVDGDRVVQSHKCKAIPGPASPPYAYKAETVEFVPGDFTAEELRAQRDAAEKELFAMRPEYHRRARKIAEAIKALNETR